MTEVHPLRVLIKALILFAIVNAVFAWQEPAVGKLSIYNWLVPGRLRVPYEREVEYYPIAHTIPVFEDMDAMYQSHVISQPKSKDEFRVALIGDSSAWGIHLHPEDMLASQLTALNLTACDGRRIVFYNTAFPLPYVAKDLLIMDKLSEYEPDMFVWMITLDAFRNRTIYTNFFLEPHAERVLTLKQEYQLNNLDTKKIKPPTFWQKTIVGQRSRLKRILILQMQGIAWSATNIDHYYNAWEPVSNDQSDSLQFFDAYEPGQLELSKLLFDVLGAGYELADKTPLLVVNEPIFIASGKNSDIRYDEFYPRWAYDAYVNYLKDWMSTRHHDYLELWNALPPSEFTDTLFHRTPTGEKMLASMIAPKLLNMICTGK
jgi:hypothetical protein